MSSPSCRAAWVMMAALVVTTSFLFARSKSQPDLFQSPSYPRTTASDYFPYGTIDGFADYFSSYLGSIGEPSLLAAAQDPRAISYRFDFMSSKGRLLVVRLSLNTDGVAEVTSTQGIGHSVESRKPQIAVSRADLNTFMQLVEKARFWSLPPVEQDKSGEFRRAYKLDSGVWIFEGVRNGDYHVILRRGPEASPFTELVQFLGKDLAKLDESTVPHPLQPSEIPIK